MATVQNIYEINFIHIRRGGHIVDISNDWKTILSYALNGHHVNIPGTKRTPL